MSNERSDAVDARGPPAYVRCTMAATHSSTIGHALGGAYPLRQGNAVTPLIDGGPAFAHICEAVESARRRVWVTVAFIDRFCEMPGGRGTFFDVLDRAARRGVDVRVLFWDEPNVDDLVSESHTFPAVEESHRFLAARDSRLRARWDRVHEHCHHQKSWVIDAGEPEEVAFVGGINIDVPSMVERGHAAGTRYLHYEGVHDVYAEVRGPASTDVAHNFVQRWNEASERCEPWGVCRSREGRRSAVSGAARRRCAVLPRCRSRAASFPACTATRPPRRRGAVRDGDGE